MCLKTIRQDLFKLSKLFRSHFISTERLNRLCNTYTDYINCGSEWLMENHTLSKTRLCTTCRVLLFIKAISWICFTGTILERASRTRAINGGLVVVGVLLSYWFGYRNVYVSGSLIQNWLRPRLWFNGLVGRCKDTTLSLTVN